MALDRAAIRRIAGGGKPTKVLVHLPVLDEDLFVRRLERDERQEVTLWAGAQMGMLDEDLDTADDLDPERNAQMMSLVSVGSLRYALCDGNGAPLIESFDEARGVFNGLAEADWERINQAFGELRVDTPIGDVEAGKASSSTTPPCSPSSTSPTSSGAGSPASSATSPTSS